MKTLPLQARRHAAVALASTLALPLAAVWSPAARAATLRGTRAAPPLPAGVRHEGELPYGPDARQRMDVYLPAADASSTRPLMVFVHGGAWLRGDKRSALRSQAQLAHWVAAQGWAFVSLDYRLVPQVSVADQLQDVAHGFAAARAQAGPWRVDPQRVVLMGHSAGAHLVALLAANAPQARALGVAPWRASVVLDSAALDVPAIMRQRHARFYDEVFGGDAAFWRRMSPLQSLQAGAAPLLLVCSTQRRDDPCAQARAFAAAAARLGVRAEVLPQDLSHTDINQTLGQPGAYTAAVDRFLASVGA